MSLAREITEHALARAIDAGDEPRIETLRRLLQRLESAGTETEAVRTAVSFGPEDSIAPALRRIMAAQDRIARAHETIATAEQEIRTAKEQVRVEAVRLNNRRMEHERLLR